jgi:hypothetical protein
MIGIGSKAIQITIYQAKLQQMDFRLFSFLFPMLSNACVFAVDSDGYDGVVDAFSLTHIFTTPVTSAPSVKA